MSGLSLEMFRDILYGTDASIRSARLELIRATGFFERRRRRDELLNEIGYGVQTLLRASSHIYAQAIAMEAATAGETPKSGSTRRARARVRKDIAQPQGGSTSNNGEDR